MAEEKNADGVELQDTVVELKMDDGKKAAPPAKMVLVGLTAAEAAAALEEWGPNLLDKPEMSLLRMFFMQFVGTMPFMLELACILSVAVGDYTDFGLILLMICVNAGLGFREQLHAKRALEELTKSVVREVPCLRDGVCDPIDVEELVPGDIVLLVGGDMVPADVLWLKGDILQIDTAALTGEPMPRKYPSEDYGKQIMAGCTLRVGEAYCLVEKTGANTEIGSSQADILKDKSRGPTVSVFEHNVLQAVKIIVFVSLLPIIAVLFIDGYMRHQFAHDVREVILVCLSIIIASVPIALPLVLQVTMALGAARMAKEHGAIVTSVSALQDIAAMQILCSDKTGTLTTANMTILTEACWLAPATSTGAFARTVDELMLFARLCSNPDKKDDPIDRAVINAFNEGAELANVAPADKLAEYDVTAIVGFNNLAKRMTCDVRAPTGNITIAKGIISKVLDTAAGGEDDVPLQWKCIADGVEGGWKGLVAMSKEADLRLSKAGYKTIAVAARPNEDSPFELLGLLPMIDPPRFDTKRTIENLGHAGVSVKMVTGDHQNIAIETARLIGLNMDIRRGEETRAGVSGVETTAELILAAGGFAQVLPADKREVVLTLKNRFHMVVGMTGDGVNDAPALSAAQCGIAVDGATDAAKNAAAIVLTSPGLSAIFGAVVESRKIFARLRSYITYRFAATIHVVSYLSILSLAYRCQVKPLFVIILALANDLSMMPVAEDNAIPAAMPVKPEVAKMLGLAATYGFVMCGTSLIFYTLITTDGLLSRGEDLLGPPGGHALCSQYVQSAVFLQISIIAELLIFSTRAPNTFFFLSKPSYALMTTTFLASVIATILTVEVTGFGDLTFSDVCGIWAFDFVVILICDISKLGYNKIFISDDTFACMPGMGGDEKNPLDMLKKMSSGNLTEQPTASTPLLAKTAGNV